MSEKTEKSQRAGGMINLDWDSMILDVLRSWWMVLLTAISAALLIGAILQLRYVPRYTTSTTFVIGRAGFSYQQVYDNLEQAETTTGQYSQVVSSSILQKRVCEELGLDSFNAAVSVQTVESTNLMVMRVTADSPRTAFLISRSIRKNALDLMGFFLDGVTMKELDPASIPSAPSNALALGRRMVRAAILGAACMVLVLAFISITKDTVKTPRDVALKVDAKLLGTINFEKARRPSQRGKKNGRSSLLLDNPMLSFGFSESYRMLATRVRLTMEREKKKVLMVTSVTENEGKSTVAANLAIALAQEGQRVLLMDCDFRNPSLYKLFNVKVSKAQDFTLALRDRRMPEFGDLSVTGMRSLFCRTPQESPWDKESVAYLHEIILWLRASADMVIMDMPPMAFVSDAEEYAALADASLLVIRQDVMEACYINDAVDNLTNAGSELLGCVLNGVRRGMVGKARDYGRYQGSNYSHYSHYRKASRSGGEKKP